MDKITEEELRAFVGPRAERYLAMWQADLELGVCRATKNWAAFLFAPFWLAYRKMYRVLAIFLGIALFESVLEELILEKFSFSTEAGYVVTSGIGILFAVVCGVWGNKWYFSHAQRHIVRARIPGANENGDCGAISDRGGTSLIAVFLGTVFFLLASSLLYTVLFGLGVIGRQV